MEFATPDTKTTNLNQSQPIGEKAYKLTYKKTLFYGLIILLTIFVFIFLFQRAEACFTIVKAIKTLEQKEEYSKYDRFSYLKEIFRLYGQVN